MLKNTAVMSTLWVLAGVIVPSACWARKVEHWSYDRLFKEADLVVIARAASSRPCKDNWSERFFEQDRFQGLEATFEVASTLKGQVPETFKLLHFKYKPDETPYNDGPGLVSFLSRSLSIDVREAGDPGSSGLEPVRKRMVSAPEYLLFLKKRKDGRYEAISGQMDPDVSVRTLFRNDGVR